MTPRDERVASGMLHTSGSSDGTTPVASRAVEEGTPVLGPGGRIGSVSHVVADDARALPTYDERTREPR